MDRIRLYEAANNTEAMNEIKAACSNMRNCIRKYANGKTNIKVKNEMLEGMKKIEADLKAVVRSSAKTGKKINESNEYVTPSYVYAIWYLYDGTNFEVVWYAPESTDMTEQDAIDKFNDTCYEFAEVGPDDSLDLTLVKLPYTNRIWEMLALCSSYKSQHPRDDDPYYDDVIEPMRMELDNNMLKCIDTWNGESADGMFESASGRRMHGDKRKFGKKINESHAPNANLIQKARALFNTGISYEDAMEEKEYANVYQVCVGDPELEGYENEVGDGLENCMAWNAVYCDLVQRNDFDNWFENLGEAVVEAKNISKELGCFVTITDDDFLPMRFFYDGEEL